MSNPEDTQPSRTREGRWELDYEKQGTEGLERLLAAGWKPFGVTVEDEQVGHRGITEQVVWYHLRRWVSA